MKELSDVERELGRGGGSVKDETHSSPLKTDYAAPLPLALPLIDTSMEEAMENSNTTKGPSVVFPSIENKPIAVNSSSFASYQYGKNKFGVEVKHRRSYFA